MSAKTKVLLGLGIAVYFGLLVWGYYMTPKTPTIEDVQDQLTQTQASLDRANNLLDQIIKERNNDNDPDNDIVVPPEQVTPEDIERSNRNTDNGFGGGGASGSVPSQSVSPSNSAGQNSTPQNSGPSPTPTPAPEPTPILPIIPQPVCSVSLLGSIVCN